MRRTLDGTGQIERERFESLVSALLTLPIRQRQALLMRELEGRSYDEIAAQLGASNGAVRQLLNRARASVRERLAALIPVELAFRWASLVGGAAPSGVASLAGSGAFAAKISSAIMLTAMPVVAVAPPPTQASPPPTQASAPPAPRHAARSSVVRHRAAPVRHAVPSALIGTRTLVVGATVVLDHRHHGRRRSCATWVAGATNSSRCSARWLRCSHSQIP
jgi:DNA-binding CsgD family transcriptional regulator